MRIHKILSLAGLAGLLSLGACFDEAGTDITLDAKVVSFNVSAKTLLESNAAGTEALLEFTKAPATALTVSYEVVATNATAGVDYTIETPSPVTIPAGAFSVPIKIKAVNNTTFEPLMRTLKITITAVSDDSYSVQANKTFTLTLINDDCPANTALWYGNISSEDVGYAVFNGTAVGTGTCNQLRVTADLIGGGVAGTITYQFTPEAPGATKGTVRAAKQNYCCPDAGGVQYQYEATGTYNEATKTINLDYKFYRRDGSEWWTGSTIIKPQA